MASKNLLVELFVEELPPKALKKLGEAFALGIYTSLDNQLLIDSAATIASDLETADPAPFEFFASPRRLGVLVRGVRERGLDEVREQKLMPVSVGLDAKGQATPALLRKLQSIGADESAVSELKRAIDGKAEALFYKSVVRGISVTLGLAKALQNSLDRLPIPKLMAYQLADGWDTVSFVRPVHGMLALHGSEVVPISKFGLTAGNTTRGHRFEAKMDPVRVTSADSYEQQLLDEGSVIASFAKRRAEIAAQLAAAAQKAGGNAKPVDDEALLDEVTALVERPNVLVCEFEREFLEVPQECLILTMKANQKYFPLLDAQGKLTNKFLVVSNIRPQDSSAVTGGNERVVRPRLADAKFFFDQDRKKSLSSRVPGLAKVVYHNKLGTQGERVERVRAIAKVIGALLGSDTLAQQADRAAELAKADLLTDMVGEFPELQGIMGRYYAQADGLGAEVADAIEDHYKPRFAGDSLPRGEVGIVVALADKLETLAGLFAIGQLPTGDKDPFALRRHALGIVRMLMEKDLKLDLGSLVTESLGLFPQAAPNTAQLLSDFIYDRLAGVLREQGYSSQEVEAVLALKPQRLGDVAKRLAAVRAFASLPEAPALAAANKRIGNILKKSEGAVAARVNESLLKEPAEQALFGAMKDITPRADAQFNAGDHTASLQALAALRTAVDKFFDDVMVNAEDAQLRANRLGLLATLHATMNRVADLSKLAA